MQFTCKTKALLAAVSACCRVAQNNGPKPVLACVHIEAGAGVTVAATDLERYVSLEVDGEVDEPGSCNVNAGKLRAALASESSESVCVVADGKQVTVRAERSTIKLGDDSSAFPVPNNTKATAEFELPCVVVVAAIRAVAWSVNEGDSRYALGGIRIDRCAEGTYFIATNGRTLAAYGPVGQRGDECAALIPVSSCTSLAAILPDEGECKIVVSGSDASFAFDGGQYISRQLEGSYPRWRDVFPPREGIRIETPAGIIAGIAAKCLLVRVEGEAKSKIERQVATTFTFGGGKLIAKAVTDIGESVAEAIIPQCEEKLISLDCGYVSDAMRAMSPSENCEIQIINHERAALLTQGPLRVVIMPLDLSR